MVVNQIYKNTSSVVVLVALVISAFFYSLLVDDNFTVLFLTLIFVLVTSDLIFPKRMLVFEPITLFSFYFYSVLLSSMHLYFSNFKENVYIDYQVFPADIMGLFNTTLIYIILCYLAVVIGYRLFRTGRVFKVDFNDGVSLKLVTILFYVFALLGTVNFLYNVYAHAGGNLLLYLKNISIRHIEFSSSGTTAAYVFSYTAAYLWLYKLLKSGKGLTIPFILFALFTVVMKGSTGRIIGTLIYMLSFFGIYYFVKYSDHKNYNFKYIFVFFLMVLLAILFYFVRAASSYSYNGMLDDSFFNTVFSFFNVDDLFYYLSSKGNIPNVAVLMKIISSWGEDINYLLGSSLVSWVTNILPVSMRPEAYQPSVMIKQIWYLNAPGGNLPPTGMGEMYANFGYVFGVLGMFFFGVISSLFYNSLVYFKSYWFLVVFINISLGFIMIYPKGEFDNLTLWYVLPIGLSYCFLRVVSSMLRVSKRAVLD